MPRVDENQQSAHGQRRFTPPFPPVKRPMACGGARSHGRCRETIRRLSTIPVYSQNEPFYCQFTVNLLSPAPHHRTPRAPQIGSVGAESISARSPPKKHRKAPYLTAKRFSFAPSFPTPSCLPCARGGGPPNGGGGVVIHPPPLLPPLCKGRWVAERRWRGCYPSDI